MKKPKALPVSNKPGGFTIFCEDIRQEVGGRATYVGVMPSILGVDTFPMIFPKLGLAITYRQPRALAPEPVELVVLLDQNGSDKELMRAPMDFSGMTTDLKSSKTGYFQANAQIVFSPLQLIGPSVVKVRAFRAGDEIKLGGLSIQNAKEVRPAFRLAEGKGSIAID